MAAAKKFCKKKMVSFCTFFLLSCCVVDAVPAQQNFHFDIPRQQADEALTAFGRQADVTVLFDHDVVSQYTTNALQGRYSLQRGASILLANTGLIALHHRGGRLVIKEDNNPEQDMKKVNMRKALLSAVIGYFAAGGQGVLAQQDEGEEGLEWALEEIVVTATKRATSLNDTAISVAAIGSEEITRKNLAEMGDYLRITPGVNFVEGAPGVSTGIVVRGLTTNAQADANGRAAVAIYYGDVPMNGTVSAGTADLRMVDLERVEVLRGPQGTLFGAGTFAGAVRNIPHAPVLNEFEGSVKATYSETTGTGSDNSKLEGVVNIPLIEDVLALRAVAYRHENSGYVENIAGTVLAEGGEIFPGASAQDYVDLYGGASMYQNHSGVGGNTSTGGRASLLWQATEDFKVTLMHVYQDDAFDGQPYVELGSTLALSDTPYVQSTLSFSGSDTPALAGVKENSMEADTNLTNLVMEYDFGWANLYSSSGWLKRERYFPYDAAAIVAIPWAQVFNYESDRFVQELRLVSQLEGRFQYLVGAYYDEADYQVVSGPIYGLTEEIATAQGLGEDRLVRDPFGPQTLDQTALFGELSYDLTEQLELTVGGRYFDYTQSRQNFTRQRENLGGGIVETLNTEFSEDGAVYKVNLSYRPNDDMLFYALWSQGFRIGGNNRLVPDDQVPQTHTVDADNNGIVDGTNTAIADVGSYNSDQTDNYELGAKLSLLDQRLQVNASLYRVDWEGIPVQVIGDQRFVGDTLADPIVNIFSFLVNGGKARSQGLELEAVYQLTSNLRVNLAGAYNDPELLTEIPQISASSGDRLSNAPEFSYNLGLLYEDEFAGYPWHVSADYAHVDEFYSVVGERGQASGDYGELKMTAGIILNQFKVELFGQNITNEDALVHVENGPYRDGRGYRLRPRTVGLNVQYKF